MLKEVYRRGFMIAIARIFRDMFSGRKVVTIMGCMEISPVCCQQAQG